MQPMLDKGRSVHIAHDCTLYEHRSEHPKAAHEGTMATYTTAFASLDRYDKGGVEVINDDPKNYVFSNMFDVASAARPWEKVAVGKNMEYVLEVIRAEGTSEWRATPHDEFALVLDGEVLVELLDPAEPQVDPGAQGSVSVEGEPEGKAMGRIT